MICRFFVSKPDVKILSLLTRLKAKQPVGIVLGHAGITEVAFPMWKTPWFSECYMNCTPCSSQILTPVPVIL